MNGTVSSNGIPLEREREKERERERTKKSSFQKYVNESLGPWPGFPFAAASGLPVLGGLEGPEAFGHPPAFPREPLVVWSASLGVKSRILLSPGPPKQSGRSYADKSAPCSCQQSFLLKEVLLLRLGEARALYI